MASFSAAGSYDLTLWPDGQSRPGTPTAAALTQTSFNPPGDLATGTLYHWDVVARNSGGTTQGPAWSFTSEGIPDLQVTAVTVPPTAFSGQAFMVTWDVLNAGNRGTTVSTWYDRVYISTAPTFDPVAATYLGQVTNPAYLGPGESYRKEGTFTLPQGISGQYYAYVLTDTANALRESNETNNTGRSVNASDVGLTPPPDLQVQAISGPANAFSGTTVPVQWTVANNGTGGTVGTAWSDRIYLSADATWESTDTILKLAGHSGALASGASYEGSHTVTLPQAIYGTYYVFAVTDIYNQIYEHAGESNNTSPTSEPLQITLTPPPDLQVSTLGVSPNPASSGASLQVTWQVTNNGAGASFETSWSDAVYLSPSTSITDPARVLLGQYLAQRHPRAGRQLLDDARSHRAERHQRRFLCPGARG